MDLERQTSIVSIIALKLVSIKGGTMVIPKWVVWLLFWIIIFMSCHYFGKYNKCENDWDFMTVVIVLLGITSSTVYLLVWLLLCTK